MIKKRMEGHHHQQASSLEDRPSFSSWRKNEEATKTKSLTFIQTDPGQLRRKGIAMFDNFHRFTHKDEEGQGQERWIGLLLIYSPNRHTCIGIIVFFLFLCLAC